MDRLSAQTSDLPRVKVLPVAVVSVAAVACLVTGCGGSKTSSSTERRSAPAAAGGAAQVVVSYGSDRVGLAGVPAAALPGITVLGTAEQTAKPDGALVRLTVGSGSDFGPGGPTFALVEQSEIDPVVHAVEKAGAEHVTVDRFGQSLYGPSQNAAQISLASHSPSEVETVIAAAQEPSASTRTTTSRAPTSSSRSRTARRSSRRRGRRPSRTPARAPSGSPLSRARTSACRPGA